MSDWETRMSERAAARQAVRWAEDELRNAVENDPPEPSAAEVLLNLPPRQDAEHCAHGKRIGGDPDAPPIAWAGGWSTCLCCEDGFGWIGSCYFSFGSGGTSSYSRTPDTLLCPTCGGVDREERHGWRSEWRKIGPPA